MGDIHSLKPRFRDRLKRFFLTGRVLSWILWPAVILFIAIVLNQTLLPWIGYKFKVDSRGIRLQEYQHYSRAESEILRTLIDDTLTLGKIPQSEYIRDKTGLGAGDYVKTIRSLAAKGDILIGKSGEIARAYPWADTSGINVYLQVDQDSAIGPLAAASALYAMSVAPLSGKDVKIESKFRDSGKPLTIIIVNNQIAYTTDVTAVVYPSDNRETSAFYTSPEAVESAHPGLFDVNKAIRLDRALVLGNIIAREIKDKIDE